VEVHLADWPGLGNGPAGLKQRVRDRISRLIVLQCGLGSEVLLTSSPHCRREVLTITLGDARRPRAAWIE
jgi:hypothetical protein